MSRASIPARLEQAKRVDELRHVARIDDAEAPTLRHAEHRLREVQIGIHPRGGVEKEDTQVLRRGLRVPRFTGEIPRECERVYAG